MKREAATTAWQAVQSLGFMALICVLGLMVLEVDCLRLDRYGSFRLGMP